MVLRPEERAMQALSAPREALRGFLHDPNSEVLAAVLENPALDEELLLLLLQRSDLPHDILVSVSQRRDWMRSYRVKLRLAAHPQTPRLTALPLVKLLYLFDLVNISLQAATPAEIRRAAEEVILARLPQIPLGQRLTLARRGSARVAGELLANGQELVIPLALDNPYLTEAQLLKVLAQKDLPEQVVDSISRHRKWSCLYNVRLALVRHPLTRLARVLAFLPDLTLGDLEVLSGAKTLSPQLRSYLEAEVATRRRASRRADRRRQAVT
jgi:hypothetical protein